MTLPSTIDGLARLACVVRAATVWLWNPLPSLFCAVPSVAIAPKPAAALEMPITRNQSRRFIESMVCSESRVRSDQGRTGENRGNRENHSKKVAV